VVIESCIHWTTQRCEILREHNCKPILENDITNAKYQTHSFNLASVHIPVVWCDVVFSGGAFCLHREVKDFMFNLMKQVNDLPNMFQKI
jgi:hypothetical protein